MSRFWWEIPSSWAWSEAAAVCDVVGGSTPSTRDPHNFCEPGSGIAWLTPADLSGYASKTIGRGERDLSEKGFRQSGVTLMPPGTVLFSSRAPIGYVAIAQGAVTTNQGFKSFVPSKAVLPDFLYYYLRRARLLIEGLASGTTFKEISGAKARTIPIPIAPLSEQRRIAESLDSVMSRLDAAERNLESAQRKLKAYRASVLKAAVEGRLVPTEAELARKEGRSYEPANVLLDRILKERRRRWEEAELSRINAAGRAPRDDKWKAKYREPDGPHVDSLPTLPEGWCWATVGQLATVGTGATPARGNERYWKGGTIPWVTSAAVNEPFVTKGSEYVTPAALDETNLSLYPPGTLLVAMYGEGKTRGRCTELAIEATTNQALAALVLDGVARRTGAWIRLFMEHNYETLRDRSAGGVQPNLNLSIVRNIAIPLPPQSEQGRIISEAEALLSSERHILEELSTAARRIARLRQAILRCAFDGRLVDQDPADEPADVLLARIRAEREAAAVAQPRAKRARKLKVAS